MDPFLKYGFTTLFAILTIVSFYVSIFQYKTTDKDGTTTYHISRSMGLFVVGLLSSYTTYGLMTGKDVAESLKAIKEGLADLSRNVTTFKTS